MKLNPVIKALSLSCVVTILMSACVTDDEPKPLSPISRASLAMYKSLFNLRDELRAYRDTTHSHSEKISIEMEMTLFEAGIKNLLSELYLKPGSDLANLARLEAIESELELSISDSVLSLLPASLAASAKEQVALTLADLKDAKALAQSAVTKNFTLSSDWTKFLEKEKADVIINREALHTLIESLGGLSEQAPLLKLEELQGGYLDLINQGLQNPVVSYNYWAKLKVSATRMTAMNQLFLEWTEVAPISLSGLPTTPMNVMDGGPGSGNSCYKMSKGDEAGTAGSGSSTGTGGGAMSTSFPITTPNPRPSGSTITPCTVTTGDTSSVPAPTPK